MADGDNIVPNARLFTAYLLIDAAAGTDNGVWVDTSTLAEGAIQVVISGVATVQIRGSDAAVKPANNTDGYQIGSDITASGGFTLTQSSRWLKAKVSTFASGTVTVTATLRPFVAV